MSGKTLEQRVSELESCYEDLKEVPGKLDTVNQTLTNFINSIGSPHFCKNDKIIGELYQFMSETPETRKRIFHSLGEHGEDLEQLKIAVAVAEENKLTLLKLVDDLEDDRKERETDKKTWKNQIKISNRQIIYGGIIGFTISIISFALGWLFHI